MTTVINTDEKFFENDNGVYFKSNYPSQWYPSRFVINNIEFNCCEQWMMYNKAKIFGDIEIASKILQETDPKIHKELGRKVQNFDVVKWDSVADDIVYEGNLAKFSQNEELKDKLLSTGNKLIVECSPYDSIWGNGLNITESLVIPQNLWKGTNRLGKAIMKVRESLNK
jgi:ribA/ribD-fused uncharacterized protein